MLSEISILEASWDGLNIKYVYSEKDLPSVENEGLIMRVVVLNQELNFVVCEDIPLLEYLQITLSSLLFEQIVDQKITFAHPATVYQAKIHDISLLHLVYLLCDEMENPKLLNQHFVSPIVTILLTHCLGGVWKHIEIRSD